MSLISVPRRMRRIRVTAATWLRVMGYFCATLVICKAVPTALAGPPYVTDDPDPVDPQHFELNIAVQYSHDADGSSGAAPRTELNYGPVENLQIGIAVPVSYDDPEDGRTHVGLGDLELSAKYRFIQETATRPMVAFFPSASLNTGDVHKSLGAGKKAYFLPLWLQKSWDDDKWTTFGGGG